MLALHQKIQQKPYIGVTKVISSRQNECGVGRRPVIHFRPATPDLESM